MSFISAAILGIIILLPVVILVMCFVVALGKRPGNRRRNPPDLFYGGPERRCKFRNECPVGEVCRDPKDCVFDEPRREYIRLRDLRNENTKDGTGVK